MQLRAGQLSITYDKGFLRWIMAGENEVLRMVYFAVRDKNWGTVEGTLINEKIDQHKDSFHISYEMLFKQGDIEMHWHASIEGTESNTILFDIKGTALSNFQKNRTGFCVLHPVKECSGKAVVITHVDGSREINSFPNYISPYQPFKNIREMHWEADPGMSVKVSFEGEVFETEDHRNWTDHNFKTYCTPLDLPYPQALHKGTVVHQKIILQLQTKSPFKQLSNEQPPIKLSIGNERIPLPEIGIGRAAEPGKFYKNALTQLANFGFGHYRVDIHLSSSDWQRQLEEYIEEAALLKTKLEVALFIREELVQSIYGFAKIVRQVQIVQQIILIEENTKCISSALLKQCLVTLKPLLPGIKLGGGTDIYFAELNRSSLDASASDFVSFSVNPQVHAFDNASLIENAFAQKDAVQSAMQKFKKPVYVSPVTLKMRYNADATEPGKASVPFADDRQSSCFAAAWAFASLKSLTEAGTSSVTYFETLGERGLGQHLHSADLQLFPVGIFLSCILTHHSGYLISVSSTKPFEICSMVLTGKNELLISNLTSDEKTVLLPDSGKYNQAKDLITGKAGLLNTELQTLNLLPFQLIVVR